MNTVQLQMYFGKRKFGMMEDGHNDFLSQALNRNQREEIDLDAMDSTIFFLSLLTCLKKRRSWMT